MKQVTDLKTIQSIVMKVFGLFDEFCREKNIEYYAAYGTLIGAVREHGMIPWDDDIDVWIKREEYQKLVKDFPEWGKQRGVYLLSCDTNDKYNRVYSKICMEHTLVETLDRKNDYDEGIFIDVFVIEGSPKNPIVRYFHEKRLQVLRNVVTLAAYGGDKMPGASKKAKVYGFLSGFVKWVDQHKISKKTEDIMAKYPCEGSDVLLINRGQKKGRYYRMPAEWFKEATYVKYDDTQMSIPNGYDGALKMIFGDYMTPPPEDKRQPAHKMDYYIDEDYIDL
ncbi:MAG: LicD family protein [Clostridia bacterium]|nr:LicD family protein [Clostridia bacterium]